MTSRRAGAHTATAAVASSPSGPPGPAAHAASSRASASSCSAAARKIASLRPPPLAPPSAATACRAAPASLTSTEKDKEKDRGVWGGCMPGGRLCTARHCLMRHAVQCKRKAAVRYKFESARRWAHYKRAPVWFLYNQSAWTAMAACRYSRAPTRSGAALRASRSLGRRAVSPLDSV